MFKKLIAMATTLATVVSGFAGMIVVPAVTNTTPEAHAATRLGLHVTQEELNIWRQRMTDNVNKINGFTYASIYQNRILADANAFKNQTHPGGDGSWAGYTGTGCVPSDNPSITPGAGGTPFGYGSGAYMMRSAYNFLLTGDRSYADPVRTELLNQITKPGTDWANTSKWCYQTLGTSNSIHIIPWIFRLLVAYDYVVAGEKAGLTAVFSATEKAAINQWFVNSANVWKDALNRIANCCFAYHGIFASPQDLTPSGGATPLRLLYYGGPSMPQATYNTFFNQPMNNVILMMGVGVMTNNASLKQSASAFATAFIKAGIWDNGAVADFGRWADCNPTCPGSMWGHTAGPMNTLTAVADMLARAGDTSLYDLTAPTQVIGGSGGTVSLRKALNLWARMANKTTLLYGTSNAAEVGPSKLLSWDTNGGTAGDYTDFASMAANLYYNDPDIHTAMTRASKSVNTSSGCRDASQGGCFSGVASAWADLPFMYGNMEGQVNPYGTGGPTPTPSPTATPTPGPGVTVDSTFSGYRTEPIDDGVINANGGTQTTWSSGDNGTDHWIAIDFGTSRQVSNATLHWAYNQFQQKHMTSNRIEVQYWNGTSYQTAGTMAYTGDVPSTTINFTPVTTQRIRFLQPANQGNPSYPTVFWITEADYGTSSGGTICHTIQNGSIIPTGFGTPWDVFNPATLLLKALCSQSGVTADLGPATYIYHQGYSWDGTQWNPTTLTCTGGAKVSNAWCPQTANGTYPTNTSFYVGYTCSWTGTEWKCGCRDQACTSNLWQLQKVN
jgi:F5/8 type C domain